MRMPFLGLVLVLLLASTAIPDQLAAGTEAACPIPITVLAKELKGAHPDTTWYSFGPGVAGCRLVNRKKQWLVEYTWFRLSTDLRSIRTYAEMDSLQAGGLLDSTTTVGTVSFRSRVRAESPADAKIAALKARPEAPPKQLLRALAGETGKN